MDIMEFLTALVINLFFIGGFIGLLFLGYYLWIVRVEFSEDKIEIKVTEELYQGEWFYRGQIITRRKGYDKLITTTELYSNYKEAETNAKIISKAISKIGK